MPLAARPCLDLGLVAVDDEELVGRDGDGRGWGDAAVSGGL